jgi:hypothetical protein
MVTYAKLQNGTYGIKADCELTVGTEVLVTKKNGDTGREVPVALVWHGQDRYRDGQAWLYATERSRAQAGQAPPAVTTCPHCGRRSDEPALGVPTTERPAPDYAAAASAGQDDLPF